MITRRYTDPVYLQYIWDALEVPISERLFNFDYLINFIQKEKDLKCSNSKLQQEISNAIKDKCITANGSQYKKVDWISIPRDNRHDSYCFQCHKPGLVIDCPTCFRVYHAECLSAAAESENLNFLSEEELSSPKNSKTTSFPPSFPCPACKQLSSVSLNHETTNNDLRNIFLVALERMRSKNQWRTLYTVGYVNESDRNNYFAIHQMNTRMISDKLRSNVASTDAYKTRIELILDLDVVVHNTAVIYGPKAEMTNTARQIRSQLHKEMRESLLCVDCYLRSKGGKPDAKQIVQPCRKLHRLLWYHHSSWSFRPCKVLSETSDGYEVVCFDGRREREFVPKQRAVDMSFTASQLGLRMTASLKRALEDSERYIKNQQNNESGVDCTLKSHQDSCQSPSELSASMPPTPSSGFTTSSEYQSSTKPFHQKSRPSSSTQVSSSASKSGTKRRRDNAKKLGSPIEPLVSSTSANYLPTSSEGRRSTPLTNSIFGSHRDSSKSNVFIRASPSSSSDVPHTNRLIDSSMAPRIRSDSRSSLSSDDSSLSSSSSASSTVSTSKRSSVFSNRREQFPASRSKTLTETALPTSKVTKRRHSMSKKPTTVSCSSISSNVSSGSATAPACSSPKINSSVVSRDRYSRPTNTTSRSQFFSRTAADSDNDSGSSLSVCEHSMPAPIKPLVSFKNNNNHPPNDSSLGSDSEEEVSSRLDSTSSSGNHDLKNSKTRSGCLDDPLNHRLHSLWYTSSIKTSDRRSASYKSKETDMPTNTSPALSHKRSEFGDVSVLKSTKTTAKRSSFETFISNPIKLGGKRSKTSFDDKESSNDGRQMFTESVEPTCSSVNHPPQSFNNKTCRTFGFTTAPSFSASSVSPAALSSSSGIGSSIMSDQKSVDASPGDLAGGHTNNSLLHMDAALIKSIEDRVQQQMSEQIKSITEERDRANAKVAKMETYVKELTRKHRNEIRETKKLSWCSKCLKQALYHCCGGVAYCSSECQLRDWVDHSRKCIRSKDDSQTTTEISG